MMSALCIVHTGLISLVLYDVSCI